MRRAKHWTAYCCDKSLGQYHEADRLQGGDHCLFHLRHIRRAAERGSGDNRLTKFLYNGRCGVSTDDNGLYYMRQRYYNTEIKRFVNQDILAGSAGNSQSLNRYSYVQGNPVSYTDPFGLAPLNGLFSGSNVRHALLGLASCIPVIGFSLPARRTRGFTTGKATPP